MTSALRCQSCGELTETKWTFCTSCGANLSLETTSHSTPKTPEPSPTPCDVPPPTLTLPSSEQPIAEDRQRVESTTQEWYSAADLYDEETTTTARVPSPRREVVTETTAPILQVTTTRQASDARKSAPVLTMLSAYAEPEVPSQFRWWHGMIVVLFILLFVGGLGVGAWYWWSHRGSVAQTSPPTNSSPGAPTENPATFPVSNPTSTIASPQVTTAKSADEEIKLLREKRIAAKPSQSTEVTSEIQQAEKKYPTDYRFPYERAKLSIAGITSHHEAFGTLAVAAEKAIDNSKAQEMLDNLTADRNGDFQKLSRGHHEWQTLEEALRDKNKNLLQTIHH